jgi:hypothetical protein
LAGHYAGIVAADLCVRFASGALGAKICRNHFVTGTSEDTGTPGEAEMDRHRTPDPNRKRRAGLNRAQFAPVVWIAVLLASWCLIVDWKMVPDLVMSALP